MEPVRTGTLCSVPKWHFDMPCPCAQSVNIDAKERSSILGRETVERQGLSFTIRLFPRKFLPKRLSTARKSRGGLMGGEGIAQRWRGGQQGHFFPFLNGLVYTSDKFAGRRQRGQKREIRLYSYLVPLWEALEFWCPS